MPVLGRLHKPSHAVIRSLSGGAVGEAWLMRNEILGEYFVRKTYDTFGIEDSVARREPRLLRELDHPHVADVLEAVFGPGEHEITFHMPYYEGGSIAKNFDDGYAFSINQSIELTVHTLDALAYLHNVHRYIHRDAKPGNVFLDGSRENAYLGDFGSVAEMGVGGRVSAIHGTALYTPPEGGPDDGQMGAPGDIYAVGMTLFEMLNGPFPYADLSPEDVDRRLTRGQRALSDTVLNQWEPCVPDSLRRVVRKAMRRDPDERFQNCSAFIDALGNIRCIDWERRSGSGLDGEWEGTWPPNEREDRRRCYRMTSDVLRTGVRRLVARERSRPGASWRRFGIPDSTPAPDEVAAVERFFADVATSASQRAPAQ
jgi:serine/threonine protein kinase